MLSALPFFPSPELQRFVYRPMCPLSCFLTTAPCKTHSYFVSSPHIHVFKPLQKLHKTELPTTQSGMLCCFAGVKTLELRTDGPTADQVRSPADEDGVVSSGLPQWQGQGKPPTHAVFVCRSSFGGPVGIPTLLPILLSICPPPGLPAVLGGGQWPGATCWDSARVAAELAAGGATERIGARLSLLETARQGLTPACPGPSPAHSRVVWGYFQAPMAKCSGLPGRDPMAHKPEDLSPLAFVRFVGPCSPLQTRGGEVSPFGSCFNLPVLGRGPV